MDLPEHGKALVRKFADYLDPVIDDLGLWCLQKWTSFVEYYAAPSGRFKTIISIFKYMGPYRQIIWSVIYVILEKNYMDWNTWMRLDEWKLRQQ